MRIFQCVLAVSYVLLASAASASEPKASPQAQQKFWALTEQIAIALPGDGRDVRRLVPSAGVRPDSSNASTAPSQSIEIAPLLFATDVAVVMGTNNRADSVSFDLSGACIPFSSVRERYPNLIVIHQAADDVEWNTLGTQVGDSMIAFWFQGRKFGCMRKVDITPASRTLSRLNLN